MASGCPLVRCVGYFGAVEASIGPVLREPSTLLVRYEELVRGDLGQLAEFFTDLGISSASLRSPAGYADRTDAFGVGEARTSTKRTELNVEQVAAAREAWTTFDTDMYRDEEIWEPFIGGRPD
jgi:hypothetical protein